MPVCHIKRASRGKLFKSEGAFGYCATKEQYYFGFKGHLLIDSSGVISGFSLAAANIDERVAMFDVVPGIQGFLLGDKGYIVKEEVDDRLKEMGIQLETPLKCNMTDLRLKSYVARIMKTRRKIETVIGQLAERFHMEKIRARDLWHLTSRCFRKILSHTIGVFLNIQQGNKAIQLDNLLEFTAR